MKKMIYFVLCLTIGLVVTLAFGLKAFIKKGFSFVQTQLVKSEQKGNSCLHALSEVCVTVVTGAVSQIKKQLPVLKEMMLKIKDYVINLLKPLVTCPLKVKNQFFNLFAMLKTPMVNIKNRFFDYVKALKKVPTKVLDLGFKLKNHLLDLKEKVVNQVKEWFVVKKVIGLAIGLGLGFVLANATKFNLFETEAVMNHQVIVSHSINEDVVEGNEELIIPSVFESLPTESIKTDSLNDLSSTSNEIVVSQPAQPEEVIESDSSDSVEEVIIDSFVEEVELTEQNSVVVNEVISESSVTSVDIVEETEMSMANESIAVQSNGNEVFIDLTDQLSSVEFPVLKIQINDEQVLTVTLDVSDNNVLE